MSKLKDFGIYFVFIIIYAILLGTITFLFHNVKTRDSVLYEYEAFRNAFGLLEAARQNILDSDYLEERGVIGFGVYNLKGQMIFQWGNAPAFIDTSKPIMSENQLRRNSPSRIYQFIQAIGNMQPFFNRMERRMMNMERLPAYLFMNIDAKEYFRGLDKLNITEFILLTLITCIMGAAAFFYHKLKRSQQILAQKEELARLGEISRTLSHEIKNPLGAMRIQTGLLKKTTDPKHHQDILLIEEEIDRLSLLTRRIGDFVRDPLGQNDKIDLPAFLTQTLKKRNSSVNYQNHLNDNVYVVFDRERLRSVIENLVQNAIESHELKQEHTSVPELLLHKDNNHYIISILDRGIGLPEGQENRIFDPAFSSKSFGSGIGLSIAKRFIEARDGKIILHPREGGGTEAHVYLKII
ncbi:MAG: HAMP domain-containing histidine kinase [Spirochaetales bacterium]|nr:HAMP domain-containing histidine kinase [Spirochaetales bacterium]